MHLWARAHDQIEKTPSLYEQHLMSQGQQVETLARQYIEHIILPTYSQAEIIWQRPYDDGQFEIRVEALIHDQQAGVYDLYEVKSSTSIKKVTELDLTFQVLVLEKCLPLRHTSVVHINKDYQQGDSIDIKRFLTHQEISAQVENRREAVTAGRETARNISQMPSPDPSYACTKPQSCPCLGLCHPCLPARPIYEIPYIGKKAAELRQMGITAIQDIPENYDLNPKQRKHTRAAIAGKPVIDQPAIRKALDWLQYPLYFLDYETFNPALPLFPGYHPYEHIVFQYSLFRVDEPGGEPHHTECLLTDPKDPAPELVPHLLNNLGSGGSVIVWNQVFEAYRNKDLAGHCPEYAEGLLEVNDRLFDLMKIFKDGNYVHPGFHGSASPKAVLPVLCSELKFEDLQISQGEEAMLNWYWIVSGQIPEKEIPDVEAAMKAYCRLDTFGMIAIFDKLCEIIRS